MDSNIDLDDNLFYWCHDNQLNFIFVLKKCIYLQTFLLDCLQFHVRRCLACSRFSSGMKNKKHRKQSFLRIRSWPNKKRFRLRYNLKKSIKIHNRLLVLARKVFKINLQKRLKKILYNKSQSIIQITWNLRKTFCRQAQYKNQKQKT